MSHTQAPKYKALQECVFAKTTGTRDQQLRSVEVQVFPNPSYDGSFRIQHGLNKPKVVVYDVLGRRIRASIRALNDQEMEVILPKMVGSVVLGVLQDRQSAATFKVAIEH
jgi:ribonuclease PH